MSVSVLPAGSASTAALVLSTSYVVLPSAPMRSVPYWPVTTVPLAEVVPPATVASTPPAFSAPSRTPVTTSRLLGRSARSTSRSTPLPPAWSMGPGRLGKRITLPLGLLSWALPLVDAAWAVA